MGEIFAAQQRRHFPGVAHADVFSGAHEQRVGDGRMVDQGRQARDDFDRAGGAKCRCQSLGGRRQAGDELLADGFVKAAQRAAQRRLAWDDIEGIAGVDGADRQYRRLPRIDVAADDPLQHGDQLAGNQDRIDSLVWHGAVAAVPVDGDAEFIVGGHQLAGVEAGAIGGGISGSGPSVFMLCSSLSTAQNVEIAMRHTYDRIGIDYRTYVSAISSKGVRIA